MEVSLNFRNRKEKTKVVRFLTENFVKQISLLVSGTEGRNLTLKNRSPLDHPRRLRSDPGTLGIVGIDQRQA
jgi:hypothetical protein